MGLGGEGEGTGNAPPLTPSGGERRGEGVGGILARGEYFVAILFSRSYLARLGPLVSAWLANMVQKALGMSLRDQPKGFTSERLLELPVGTGALRVVEGRPTIGFAGRECMVYRK